MNPAEIDALVASVQAAKAAGQPISSLNDPVTFDEPVVARAPTLTEF